MKKRIGIHIGGCYASRDPAVIYTLLGSCVAVCLYDPLNRVGGMNHILLPGKADMKRFNDSARYGVNAMELLINRIVGLGGDRRRLAAKVFGGANVMASISNNYATGGKNVSFVLEFLNVEGIRLLNKNVGGTDTRRIYFHTDTGDVFLKRLPSLYQQFLSKEEAFKFRQAQEAGCKPGEVTLFDDQ